MNLFQKSEAENIYRHIEMTDDAASALSWHCSIIGLENAFDKAELQSASNFLHGWSTLARHIWTRLKIWLNEL